MLRPAVVVLALVMAGCGGGSKDDRLTLTTPKATATPSAESTATATPGGGAKKKEKEKPGPVTQDEDRTIRGWADALRHGHVDRAVGYWEVPAVYSNGDAPVQLPTARAIREVNDGFPCGAKVVSLRRDPRDQHFVDAVFVLTERRGSAKPCDGPGGRAETAFRIRKGKIAEWLRLPNPPEENADPGSKS